MKKRFTYRDFENLPIHERIEQQMQNILINGSMATPAYRYEIRRAEKWEADPGYNGAVYDITVYKKRKKNPAYCLRFWVDAFRGMVRPESMEWVFGYENLDTAQVVSELIYDFPEIAKDVLYA